MKKKTKKITVILNDHRDIPMLVHLWKWKVATTASLYVKFYSDTTPASAYNRMNRLKQAGFMQVRRDFRGDNPVWLLDKKGFLAIKDILPDLKEEGYKSEHIIHDLWCSAAHLGEFLVNKPDSVQLISEQQLRRYYREHLPTWVPSPDLHRPDGYWYFEIGERKATVALEIEKSRKSNSELEKLATFYANFNMNFKVLWLVEGKGLLKRLSHFLTKASRNANIHNYVMLKGFLLNGWQSKIVLGPDQNRTISDFIYENAFETPINRLCAHTTKLILDKRISYQNNSEIPQFNKPSKLATV